MNTKILIVTFGVLLSVTTFAQVVCVEKGISTNPDAPINPEAPSPLWLNEFKWYDNDGLSLFQYALHDMFSVNGQELMSHPYSNQNSYGYLTDFEIQKLDMYPDQGWELISLNLGAYPNGELLSEQSPPQESVYAEIPYLLLYNKERGVLRLFANTLTGLTNQTFDAVVITLQFNESPENGTSGLLRHNNGKDQALDQYTSVILTKNTVDHPNNSSKWFHTDFQVGYDPCTCLYRSDLRLQFDLINESYLKMTSNGIYLETPIVDENGLPTIPNDFLTSVNYQDGYEDAGLVIYNSMSKMIDDYLLRLEAVESYNDDIGANNAEIKRRKAVLKAFKQVAILGLGAVITGALATEISEFATDIVQAFDINQTVVIKEEKLTKEAEKILGKGFDWLSKHYKTTEELKKKATPTMPTATVSQTTFDGQLISTDNVLGPNLFNPGSYPSGTTTVSVDAHNYPVYNEVLGLFALLETPRFNQYFSNESIMLNNENVWTENPFPQIDQNGNYLPGGTIGPTLNAELYYNWSLTDYSNLYEENIHLAGPLKYTFNPAAGIDIQNVEISCAIVVQGETSTSDEFYQHSTELIYQKAFPQEGFERTISLNNMNSAGFSPTLVGDKFVLESEFFPIDIFNNLTTSVRYETFGTWKHGLFWKDEFNIWHHLSDGITNGGGIDELEFDFNSSMESMEVLNEEYSDFDNVQYELKLMVKMPFLIPDSDGSIRSTTQVFTYEIEPTQFISSWDPLPIQFSVTENPNSNGITSIQNNLGYGVKNWTLQDFSEFGGFFIDPPQTDPVVRSYAAESINIFGDQTISQNLAQVQMIAGNEISVTGDVTILGDILLKVENFIGMSATPNPPADETYLVSFCSGLGPNTYNANQLRHSDSTTNLNHSFSEKRKDVEAKIQLFPNPASKELNLSLSNISGNVEFAIFNSIGVLMSKHIRKLENSYGVTNISFDISSLPEGSYTLIANNEYRQVAERFIVIH